MMTAITTLIILYSNINFSQISVTAISSCSGLNSIFIFYSCFTFLLCLKWFITIYLYFTDESKVDQKVAITAGRKLGALRPQKPLRLIRDGEVGGQEIYIWHLLATLSPPPEWLCIKVGSCVSHFNVSWIVWAKSEDSVHKPQLLKRKESRSGSNRGPSAYQPSALPLGHTGFPDPQLPRP